MPGRAVLLEARDIALTYRRAGAPDNAILNGFSLRLHAGELIAVLGPSGIGKSSLLRVLAGLQSPHKGEVSVHGRAVGGPHPRVCFLFQDPCLLPWLTLEANVGFGLSFKHQPHLAREERRHRVDRAIAEVGLEAARHAYLNELSGGMKQRGALARGIARQPEILLLDEPFGALDEITRHAMQALLRAIIVRHHAAAILVTHDIDEALLLAERILLIGGRPAQQIANWTVALTQPRDEASPELSRMRGEIARAMLRARSGIAEDERFAA